MPALAPCSDAGAGALALTQETSLFCEPGLLVRSRAWKGRGGRVPRRPPCARRTQAHGVVPVAGAYPGHGGIRGRALIAPLMADVTTVRCSLLIKRINSSHTRPRLRAAPAAAQTPRLVCHRPLRRLLPLKCEASHLHVQQDGFKREYHEIDRWEKGAWPCPTPQAGARHAVSVVGGAARPSASSGIPAGQPAGITARPPAAAAAHPPHTVAALAPPCPQ